MHYFLELLENQSTTVESSLHISDSFLMIVDRTTTLQLNVITHAKHTHGVGNTKWQLFKWAKIANVCSNTTYVVVVCWSLVKKNLLAMLGSGLVVAIVLYNHIVKLFRALRTRKDI